MSRRAGWPRRILRGTCAMAAALLGACAVTPPDPPGHDFYIPARFGHATPDGGQWTPNADWWRAFGDTSLDQFVNVALHRNAALAQAVARRRIAEAQVRLQGADRLPQLSLGAGISRQRQNLGSLPGLGAAPGATQGSSSDVAILSTASNASLDISWELDLWGRLGALSAAAQAAYLASDEQLRAMRQSIAAEVVQGYFDIVHARAQVDLSDRTVRALAETARQINNRSETGIAAPADSLLADANLASARAGLEQNRESLERLLRQMEVLLGQYPLGEVASSRVLPGVPALPPTGVPADLLARRPDVRAAELVLQGSGYELAAAQRSFLPSLSLNASAGYAGSAFSDLFRSGNFIWSIAGNLLQPVFQGGRLVAQVDIAGAQRDENLHAYAETALNALAEVETALAVDARLLAREQALDTSAAAAEQAVRVSMNRYLQGIDPFLNVLESHQRALDGRSAQISARHARIENRIALHLALGGGFEDEDTRQP